MNEMVKICKVHGELPHDQIYIHPSNGYLRCKLCRYEYQKEYIKNNPESISKSKKNYCKKNIEKLRIKSVIRNRKYKKENSEHCNKLQNINSKKRCAMLTDSYVRQTIYSKGILKTKDITKEMVEIKRIILTIKRRVADEKHNRT